MVETRMDWHKCDVCGMAHPFSVPKERGCPNEGIVRATGLRGLAALKASGIFDRGVGRPRSEVRGETAEAKKPWDEAGVSRANWYRRRRELRDKGGS